jgi:hypothetical protein
VPLAPWATADDLPASRPALDPDTEANDAAWSDLAALATAVLFTLSGRRWAGAVERTVEVIAAGGVRWPLVSAGTDWWYDGSWGAHLVDGEIVNHSCCPRPPEVRLPHAPIAEIIEVRVGATVRDAGTYRLRDRAWLEDLTGRGWPTCDPGVVVTYRAGTDPPPEARAAAVRLLLELGYARAGDTRCALPRNITAITRQGITTSFTPAAELIKEGRTGLTDVDLWLATVNPTNRRHRPSSWSPDTATRTYDRTGGIP